MKKIFAILLSLQLVLFPVAVTADDAANAGLTDAYMDTGTGGKGGYDFILNQIGILGVTAIGSSIITQCLEGLKTPSIATYMAGSLVYMMSEIIGGRAKNERNKKKMSDIEIDESKLTKEGDSYQKGALEQALQEEKDNRDFLKERKIWMIAVTTIFTAAMGLAIAEEFYGQASGQMTSQSSCAAYAAGCAAGTFGVGAAECEPHCVAGITGIIPYVAAIGNMHGARTKATAYCKSFTPALAGCEAWYNSYLGLVYGACLPAAADGGASFFSWKTLLTLAYGFGASQLGSSGGGISQYGTMLISLLSMVIPSLSALVEKAYNLPIPRSITFGASAAISGGVTIGLAHRQGVAEENVGKLEKVLADFKLKTEGTDGGIAGGDTSGGDPNDDIDKGGAKIKTLPTASTVKNCFSNGTGNWTLSEKNCGTPYKVPRPNLSNMNFPTLKNVSSLSADMAQALADGDNSRAAKIGGQIGSLAAKVKAETDALKKAYNDYAKKNKKPVEDFDKSINSSVAGIMADINKAAAASNINLASASGSSQSGLNQKSNNSSDSSKKAGAGQVIGTPEIDPMAGLGNEAPAGENAVANLPEQSLDDFETSEQDISKKSDVSIFKQLSHRYILNYSKFFNQRPKVDEAEKETKKK